jgi:hypothetical protein
MLENYKEIIIGTLLGDSSLQTFTNGNTWRLRFFQKDKEFIDHLYDQFQLFVKTPPKLSDDGCGNLRWYFNTIVIPDLLPYALQFYTKKGQRWVKIVPSNLEITAKTLAYWYMDNGTKKSNVIAYYLCTDSFSLAEVKLLGTIFKSNWNIHVSYHKKGNNYRIFIPTKYAEIFKDLIKDYIINSFKYKL